MIDGSTVATTLDVALTGSDATVDMWTDGAFTNTVGAFLLAGIASLLY